MSYGSGNNHSILLFYFKDIPRHRNYFSFRHTSCRSKINCSLPGTLPIWRRNVVVKFIERFFKDELAIDLGTVNTLIYRPDHGVVLNEPSVVAVDRYDGEVVSVGHKALRLLGREPRGIEVHRPIRSGTIHNFEVTQKMLRSFIRSVTDGYRRGHFVVGIPGSATAVEQRSVRDAVRDAGGRRIDLVDEGLAAGLGAGLSFEDERAHLVVDIGGGTTNIAIVASGGVVSSTSLTAAGNAMDESIRDYVRANYCLQIGENTAEALKKEMGVLGEAIPVDERKMKVVGKQLSDGSACAVHITAEEVREALEPVLNEIVVGVHRVIEDAQPEAVADIFYSGVILTGGGSLLKGIKDKLQSELRLRAMMPENPITTVVVGAGTLLAAPQQLHRCAIRPNLPVWQEAEELVISW
jgi:rod shape-determining protein MreB